MFLSIVQLTILILTVSSFGAEGWKDHCPDVSRAEESLYYGFFINSFVQNSLKRFAKFQLGFIFNYKEYLTSYSASINKTDAKLGDIEEHIFKNPTNNLHVTTMFCNYGKVKNCSKYAEMKQVQNALGKSFTLNVQALFITPRTLGFRVKLDKEQVELWNNGGGIEKANGERAHITVTTAQNVSAVQTGFDLLEILRLEERNREPVQVNSIVDFGKGRIIYYTRPVSIIKSTFCAHE